VGVAAVVGVTARTAAAPLEYRVKAGFLYNFAKFIDWPASSFAGPQAPYNICVLGPDPFGEDLDEAVGANTVQGRRIAVRRLADARQAVGCHILFVAAADRKKLPSLFQSLGEASTLTVGEDGEFTSLGGGLRFFLADNRVRFEINLQAIERAHLKVSAKLLNVARVVGKPGGGN
jgi:hypothetical protein